MGALVFEQRNFHNTFLLHIVCPVSRVRTQVQFRMGVDSLASRVLQITRVIHSCQPPTLPGVVQGAGPVPVGTPPTTCCGSPGVLRGSISGMLSDSQGLAVHIRRTTGQVEWQTCLGRPDNSERAADWWW